MEGERAPRSYTVVSNCGGKLLITEVNAGSNIYPYTGIEQIAPELVEIHNPNPFAVDLSDYYLTDAISYVSGEQLYWHIAEGDPTQATVGGGNYNDALMEELSNHGNGNAAYTQTGDQTADLYIQVIKDNQSQDHPERNFAD